MPIQQNTPRSVLNDWPLFIKINVNYLGLTAIAQSLTPLLIPLLIQQFVGEARQATFFGNLRLWTLMVAVLVQSLAGMLSDHSTVNWGKRRPFILVGMLFSVLFLGGIGITTGLDGMTGYWTLFVFMIFLMVSVNIAQSGQQGFIPDLVPESVRGKASGIKSLFEIPLPLIFVAFTIAPLIGAGNIPRAIGYLILLILLCLAVTMAIREQPPAAEQPKINWKSLVPLLIMTVTFSLIILLIGGALNIMATLLSGKITASAAMYLFGIAGVVGIATAVSLGVFTSTRIGLGKKEANQNRRFSWWIVNRLMFLVGAVNIASFAVYYLQVRFGFQQESASGPASYLLLFIGLAILLSVLPAGLLSDRFGHKRMLVVSGIAAASGVIGLLIADSLTIIYICAVVIGMATGLFYTSNWALGTQIIPKDKAGKYLGISNLAGAGAGAVGAFIGGPIADFFAANYQEDGGSGYILLFAIYGCMIFISTLITKKLA